ncbi:MAG: hypothetical protein ABIR62_03335 [Dokdonella sp.]|uniref:hypothetical protein n=1 Tax=Dokdonella sp. TaxID=2291710 RepID=UPI003264FA21
MPLQQFDAADNPEIGQHSAVRRIGQLTQERAAGGDGRSICARADRQLEAWNAIAASPVMHTVDQLDAVVARNAGEKGVPVARRFERGKNAPPFRCAHFTFVRHRGLPIVECRTGISEPT